MVSLSESMFALTFHAKFSFLKCYIAAARQWLFFLIGCHYVKRYDLTVWLKGP